MNDIKTPGEYGVLTDPTTLTIQRFLPGPIERVWSYLTESDLRRRWLAAGDMEMVEGSTFELTWRNSELTDPPGAKPEGFGEEHSMASRIVELDPPHKLVFTWNETGEVSITLEQKGERVLLTLVHSRLSRDAVLMVGPGWHAHLDLLVAHTSDSQPEPFWDSWLRLKSEYEKRLS